MALTVFMEAPPRQVAVQGRPRHAATPPHRPLAAGSRGVCRALHPCCVETLGPPNPRRLELLSLVTKLLLDPTEVRRLWIICPTAQLNALARRSSGLCGMRTKRPARSFRRPAAPHRQAR